MSAVSFRVTSDDRPRLRRASIDLGVRALRLARMNAAADVLSELDPVAVVRGPAAKVKVVFMDGARGVMRVRDGINVMASDWNLIARSSRRGGLMYAARVLERSRVGRRHQGAVAYLRAAADGIQEAAR